MLEMNAAKTNSIENNRRQVLQTIERGRPMSYTSAGLTGDAAYQPNEMGTKQSVNLRTEWRQFYTIICNAAEGYASHEADAELAKEGFLISRCATQMRCIGRGSKNKGMALFGQRQFFILWWSALVARYKLEVPGGREEELSLCSAPARPTFRQK